MGPSIKNSVDTLIAPQPQNNTVFHITFINTRCPTVWTITYEQSLSENLNQQTGTSIKLPLVNFNTHFLRNFHTEFLIKIVFKTLNDLKGPTFNLCKAQLDFFHSNCL